MEVGFHPVVKQHAHDARGDDGGDDLEPQLPCLLFLPLRLPGRERVELMEEQDDHGQNRAQLDDHVEHAPEFVGNVQGNEFVQQNQMSRGGNGQPLRDTLHNAEKHGF